MKVYWQDSKKEHLLLVEPAAKLLTMKRLNETTYKVECLNQTEVLVDIKTIDHAKRLARIWFDSILQQLLIEIRSGGIANEPPN